MINDAEDLALKAEIARRGRAWDQRFRRMESELARKTEQITAERMRTEMAAYIQRRLSEEVDTIAPELASYVSGNSPEAVEQSIERAKAKTASIVAGLREGLGAVPAQPGIQQGPQAQPQQPQPRVEDVESVEVGSPEHLRLRQAYGIDRARGQGIFG